MSRIRAWTLPLVVVASGSAIFVGGCGLLPIHAETGTGTKAVRKVHKPRDAKSFYVRMSEIEHGAEVLVAAEFRRFRRAAENASLTVRKRELTTMVARMTELVDDAGRDVKALGTPPKEVRPFYDLQMRMLGDSKSQTRRIGALARRGDIAGFLAEMDRPDPAHRALRAETRRTETALRHKFGLGAKSKSPYERMVKAKDGPRPSAAPPRTGRRMVASIDDPRVSRADRAFVKYAFRLQTIIRESRTDMDAFTRRVRENLPRDPAESDAYVRAALIEAQSQDRRSVAKLRRLGTAPEGLGTFKRLLERQATKSIAGIDRILAGPPHAREMIEALYASEGDDGIKAEIRAEAKRVFVRLEEIKVKYGG